jgi:hypothetical protein
MSAINPNRTLPKRGVLALLLASVCSVDAQAGPPPPGPHGPPPAPSAEELATVPSLSAEQQIQLHKILAERRDAHEAIEKHSRDVLDAQRDKDRAEHERIDEQSSDHVRKLLGEDGFRRYAEWQLAHRGPARGGPPRPGDARPGERPGPNGRAQGAGLSDDAPPPPPNAGAD